MRIPLSSWSTFTKHTKSIHMPKAPENIQMINVTFIRQSAPDIKGKLQKLDEALGTNPSQLVNIAFKVYYGRE